MNSLYQIIREVVIQSATTNGRKKLLCRVVSLFVFALFIGVIQLNAQRTYTWTGATSGNWNNTLNWTQSQPGGTFPGNIESNDIVIIPNNGSNAPVVNVTPNNAIASLTFTGVSSNPQFTINDGNTLTVTGAVTLNSTTANRIYTITGSGTLSCGSFTLGTAQIVPGNRLTTLIHTLTNITVQNNFTIATYRSGASNLISCTYTHTSGTTIVNGTFVTSLIPSGGTPTATYAMGNGNPELHLHGSPAMTLSTSIINSMDFVGTGAFVYYASTSNVSLPVNVTGPPATTGATTYTNLRIGGRNGSVKTAGGNMTVSGVLTVESETTLALGTFTLGSPITLELNTQGGGIGSSITGSGLITLGGDITVTYKGPGDIITGASIANPISLGATRTIQVDDDGNLTNADLTINGVISSGGSSYGITKTVAGKLVLTAANSFHGPILISAGILSGNTMANIGTTSAFGTGTLSSTISIAATGTLEYTGTGHSTTRPIALTGSGGTIAASGSGLFTMSGSVSGNTFGIVFTGTGTGQYAGTIGTTTGTVTKSGTGTWKLSGANTYSGSTTISGGTLLIGANVAVSTPGPLGNSSALVFLGDAATTTNNWSPTLLLDGAFSFARAITIANQATSGVYTIGGNTDNNASFSGAISFNRSFSITQVATTSTNALTVSGSIASASGTKTVTFNNVGAVIKSINAIGDGSGITAVVKNNTGTLTMSVANTYSLSTTLNAGTLNINNAAALGNASAVFTINGGTIQNTTGGSITTNNYPINWGGSFTFSGSQPLNLGTGNVNGNGSIQITTLSAGVALTFGGVINSNATDLSLIKNGPGNLNFVNQSVLLSNLTINLGSFQASTGNMSIEDVFTNNATYSHNNGTVSMTTNFSSIVTTTPLEFNHLTISATHSSPNQYSHGFSVAGTLTINGGVSFAPAAGTITMSGATGSIHNASGTLTFYNLLVSGLSVSSTGNLAVANTMSVTGEFNPDATSVISGAGTLTGTGTVNVTRVAATPSFGAQYTIANKSLADLTVDYNGVGAQTVSTADYGTLVISTNGTRTVTFENGGTVRVSNVFTPTATNTTYVVLGNIFEYNGSGSQTIAAFTYHDLILSNAASKTVLAGTYVYCQTLTINGSIFLILPDTSQLIVLANL